jgi:hypothetical protein
MDLIEIMKNHVAIMEALIAISTREDIVKDLKRRIMITNAQIVAMS